MKKQYWWVLVGAFMLILLTIIFKKIYYYNSCKNRIEQINNVSSQEKDLLNKILLTNLNNNYRLVKKIRSGQTSTAYLIENKSKGKFILKFPSNLQSNFQQWLDNQHASYLSISNITQGYNGKINMPKCIESGDEFIIEKYLGEELNEEIFKKLDSNDKHQICEEIADFMVFLHNNKNDKNNLSPITLPEFFTLDDCYRYLNPILLENQKQKLSNIIDQFTNRDISDEVVTKVHYDLRLPNILYDVESKTLAIIDFECVREDNVYYDFCPRVSPRLPIEMIQDIINCYNNQSHNKINFNKVKLFYDIFSIYEICTCAKFRDGINPNDIQNEKTQQLRSHISCIFDNLS